MYPEDRDPMSFHSSSRHSSHLKQRGVWQADFFGPNGELVLVAVTRLKRRIAEEVVPHGSSRIEAAERLQDALDRADPLPNIRII